MRSKNSNACAADTWKKNEATSSPPPSPFRHSPRARLRVWYALDQLRLLQAYIDLRQDEDRAQEQEEGADRAFEEDEDVAARDQHGAAEILLEPRTQHESEQDRSREEVEQHQQVADQADRHGLADQEHVVVGRINADRDEEQRARIE